MSYNIVATGFTTRTMRTWLPLLDIFCHQGGRVSTILFPNADDPDSAGLAHLPYDNVLTAPMDGFRFRDDEHKVFREVETWCRLNAPDLILCTTIHMGPETRLIEQLRDLPRRPKIVGLQHGVFQDWEFYNQRQDCYDYLGLFGDYYLRFLQDDACKKALVLGIPKLDRLSFNGWRMGQRKILFCAQFIKDKALLISTLKALEERMEALVIVRPHPELHAQCQGLSDHFEISSPENDLYDDFKRVDSVITTGSTTVIEGLFAGLRVAVLPIYCEDIYRHMDIVAAEMSAQAIAEVLSRFDAPHFAEGVRKIVAAMAGSLSPDIGERAYTALVDAVGDSLQSSHSGS